MVSELSTRMLAYKVQLDPSHHEARQLQAHAGAARTAFNYHLAAKKRAHDEFRAEVDRVIEFQPDLDRKAANKIVSATKKFKIPSYMDSTKAFFADPDYEWRSEYNRYAIVSAMSQADQAYKNWMDALSGKRQGDMGYPRFKSKGRCKDSFTLYDTGTPISPKRIKVPEKITGRRNGTMRVKGNLSPLWGKLVAGKARVIGITFSRQGVRWYASLKVEEQFTPHPTTKKQVANGTVGIDVGVKVTAALSTGEIIDNPRFQKTYAKKLKKAQQALARTRWVLLDVDGNDVREITSAEKKKGMRTRPTAGRIKAQQRVAKVYADMSERRVSHLHQISKRVVTHHDKVAMEDLNVVGMVRSAKGTVEAPGVNVAAKSGLNREILDSSFSELRRQVGYKSTWYGSELHLINRFAPSSKRCSNCGEVKNTLKLSDRIFKCEKCGMILDRDLNAALNIKWYASGDVLVENLEVTPTDAILVS